MEPIHTEAINTRNKSKTKKPVTNEGPRNENKNKGWRIGTWNVRGLNGKENELIQEMSEAGIDLLAITETKKKGQSVTELNEGYTMILSGVGQEVNAKRGVGCVMNQNISTYLTKWETISEEILKVEFKMENKETLEVIILYGPDENEKKVIKDKFWEASNEVIEKCKGNIIILGDLNGRVGLNDASSRDVIGNHGEVTRNSNGKRIIDFCLQNNLLVMNTFFKHKDIHKYTREVKSRNEKSIIDYVLIDRDWRKRINDVRVLRGAEIGSDHYLLRAKTTIGNQIQKTQATTKIVKTNPITESIKSYKLSNEEVSQKFCTEIEEEISKNSKDQNEQNLEEIWSFFKNTIINAAKKICGTSKINKNKKQTSWWSKEINEETKLKKKKWKVYLSKRDNHTYNDYKKQRRKVKELILEAKKKCWEDFGHKMETDYQTNQKLFYRVIKNSRTSKTQTTIKQIKDKNGNLLTTDREIIERWKEHFQGMFNPKINVAQQEEEDNKQLEQGKEEEIDEIEIREAIKMLKNGKAAGHDQITAEMLKSMGSEGLKILKVICNKAWMEGKVPQDWKIGIIVPLHKKGDKSDCSNYRGITLLSIVSKIYERILQRKLTKITEPTLEQSQSGFRKGRSIQDHIFTIKQLTEKFMEKNEEFYMAFIDLEKAFDSVPINIVEDSMMRRNVPPMLIRAIMSLLKDGTCCVRTDNMQSAIFPTNEGLRQGGVLSPDLFNLAIDDVIKEVNTKISKLHVGYRNLVAVWISECAFADDVGIFARNKEQLQQNLIVWNEALKARNLKINENKTKIMKIGKTQENISIKLNNKEIEQVDSFKYLGTIIDSKGSQEKEINARIESASRVFHSLKNVLIGKKEVSRKAKMSIYKTVFLPTLTFGSESWTLSNKLKSRIQSMEMKYLRKVLGVTRLDRLRNSVIREELQISPALETVERNQLRWFGHLNRMLPTRPTRKIYEARKHGRRPRGRPARTWEEEIEKIFTVRGITKHEAKTLSVNKAQWRKFVYNTDIIN